MDTIKTPGPDHPITVEAHPTRVQVLFEGHVIGDSQRALALKEASYREVLYFPREDIAMAFLGRTDRSTHCPYKGHANYYSIDMDGHIAENAVWTYEDPYPAMDIIRGYLAFYPNQVTIHELPGAPGEISPDEVIKHTDSGSGTSQGVRWEPAPVRPPEG